MRRYGFLILFVVVLLAPFVVRWAVGTGAPDDANAPTGIGAAGVAGAAAATGGAGGSVVASGKTSGDAPGQLPGDASRQTPAGKAAPATDGGVVLVVITPHNQDIRREFARAFEQWHAREFGSPVTLQFLTPGGANDVVRQLDAFYANYRDADGKLLPEEQVPADIHVVWGGGDTIFDRDLKRRGLLRPIGLPAGMLHDAFPQPTLGGVRLHDAKPADDGTLGEATWVGVCLSSFGIVYSPELCQAMGLPEPKTWKDLADPRLVRLLALADPTHSGSAAVTYMMVLQRAMADAEEAVLAAHPELKAMDAKSRDADERYHAAIAEGWHDGMGTLLLMAANTRYFTDSASQVPNDVAHGEAAAGVAIDFYARVTSEAVGESRLTYVAPAAATAITPDPVGILYGTKRDALQAAERFVQFLLSPQGQRLWILNPGEPGGPMDRGLRRPPIRQDVYADQTGWSDLQNPFTESGGFNQRAEWMSLFSDVRPVWAAAWIDSREDLRRAYSRVLDVGNMADRDALLAKLADLPITYDEVAQMSADRKQLEQSSGDVGQWRAKTRIELANRFREHYDAVAEEAKTLNR